ncbi:hypothetical protein Pan153_30100 [Gimesia panareensis]|uniref:DUF1559 domain-containing protein n=1 Tax=Gimesia panareensis TaxID=2527978 RepID=A0A518FPS8_9PLAN|nr:DUF1559 domain-containing protein [Gimesia panareensis]QDV18353.1 hypothetical protein Pan153_30100 [Gimesia panareensis]
MPRQLRKDLGIMTGVFLLLIALLSPAIQYSRTQARLSMAKNNLKQMGLALHNYHDCFGCFPPGGVIRQDGTAMHGWMTRILPFLDANPYYNMVKYEQPWVSPENILVFENQRLDFQIPERDMGLTSGGYAITCSMGNPNLLHRNHSVRLREITKGSSHTWIAGEVAGNFQPWGYPFNWRPLGTKLCDGPDSFGQLIWDGAHLLLADGSVHFYSTETAPEILQALTEAPPIATRAQTAVPARTFTIGDYYWDPIDLQSDPQGERQYIVKVLRSPSGVPLKMSVRSKYIVRPGGELEYKGKGAVFLFLAHIGPQTDIASTLKATTLAKESTPAQFESNVKLLRALQQELPAGREGSEP